MELWVRIQILSCLPALLLHSLRAGGAPALYSRGENTGGRSARASIVGGSSRWLPPLAYSDILRLDIIGTTLLLP